MDVEELSRLGSRRGSCPYYASRAALPGADLVLLPYASLLSHVNTSNCCPPLSAPCQFYRLQGQAEILISVR